MRSACNMWPAGRGLLISDLIGSPYFTSIIFTFIWNLKLLFYYSCHLPRLDKALNFEHAMYFALRIILRTKRDFFLKRNYWYGLCNWNVVSFLYCKNWIAIYWHYLNEINDSCTWINYHKFKNPYPEILSTCYMKSNYPEFYSSVYLCAECDRCNNQILFLYAEFTCWSLKLSLWVFNVQYELSFLNICYMIFVFQSVSTIVCGLL